jgi:hypothetical protein
MFFHHTIQNLLGPILIKFDTQSPCSFVLQLSGYLHRALKCGNKNWKSRVNKIKDIPEIIHFIICFFLVLKQVRSVIYWTGTQYPECDIKSKNDMRKFINLKTNGLLITTAFCICNVKLQRVVLDKE